MTQALRRAAFALAATAFALAPGAVLALPGFADVKAAYVPSEATLLARDGRPLQTVRIDHEVRRFGWTPLHEVSPALLRAVVLAEDKRFFEHGGVDWQAAGNAAWNNVWDRIRGTGMRGASTLTMQLVGLMDEDNRRHGRRSVLEKATQATLALRIDGRWSKRQILEAYLNLAPFRGELQGVSAMSRVLFGKWPDGLNEREAAIAAALLRAPNASPSRVGQRACAILKEMDRPGECEGIESFAAMALSGGLRHGFGAAAENPNLAPHLARRLLSRPGQMVTSTVDADLQGFAREALRQHLGILARQNAQDGAVVVIDNASGELLAWVGSSGDLSDAPEVDGVVAPRQAGSTLKPFLYALAFERRNMTPASLIEDAPLTLETGSGLYAPQNYEPQYRGWVSARTALAGSLNVPAVRVLTRLGPDTFAQRLRQAGLDSLTQSGDWYGYSLALGSADVSLLALTNAYRSLANAGRWSAVRALPSSRRPADCPDGRCGEMISGKARRVFTPEAAFLVGDILSDRNARAGTFGLESWLATPYWTAVKTGTSKDMRDNWCMGFSSKYTVGVWVGNASGQPMHDVSGVSGAAPVWRDVMDWLHRGNPASGRFSQPSRAPLPPAGLVRTSLRFDPPYEPPRQEWFIGGTESRLVRSASASGLASISYPADGTVIALDPDIPPRRQRMPLRASGSPTKGSHWQLDGQPIGPVSEHSQWRLQPGRHRLALLDRKGDEVDSVNFEVRALRAKANR